jgi:hypothetical protein
MPIQSTGSFFFLSSQSIWSSTWRVMKFLRASLSTRNPLLPKLLAQLQAIKTSRRSCIVIPRSFNEAYSPGHSSIGDKASLAEFEGNFDVIFSQYHHASWYSWSPRNFPRIKSIKAKVRFQTLPIALRILVLCSPV